MSFWTISIVIIDVLITFFLVYFIRKEHLGSQILQDLVEEKKILTRSQKDFTDKIDSFYNESRKTLNKMTQLAAEVEKDTELSQKNLKEKLEGLAKEFTEQIDKPMDELAKRQNHISGLLKKSDRSYKELNALIVRTRSLLDSISNESIYENIVSKAQGEKYSEAKMMLEEGYSNRKISKDLGLNLAEVELVAETNVQSK